MRIPYGIEIVDNCTSCPLRKDGAFCHLPLSALEAFERIHHPSVLPKGAVLFMEGQSSRGVYMLCTGRVKLTTCSKDGKAMILQVAQAGEVLGLSAVVSGAAYEVTAETLEPCQVNFIKREDFLRFLSEHGEASLNAVQVLSTNYHAAYQQIRSLGLSTTSAGKLAKLLLDWGVRDGEETRQGLRIKMGVTHEEVAQMIGSSRETVTRLFGELKGKGVIHLKGSTLIILNKPALESLVA
jgi:CRP/FNR family transcriptional regulator